MDWTAMTTHISHMKQSPASTLASKAFKFNTDADTIRSAILRVLSISIYAARTSKSSLLQNDKGTAGGMLPKVENSIALPLLLPYKSEVAHLGALPIPNYFFTMSLCSRKRNSFRYA